MGCLFPARAAQHSSYFALKICSNVGRILGVYYWNRVERELENTSALAAHKNSNPVKVILFGS